MRVRLFTLALALSSPALLVAQPPPGEVGAVEVEGLPGATAACQSATLMLRKTFVPPAEGALLQVRLAFRLPQEAPLGLSVGAPTLTKLVANGGAELPVAALDDELWDRAEFNGGKTTSQGARVVMEGAVHLLRPTILTMYAPLAGPLPLQLALLESQVPVMYPADPVTLDLDAKAGATAEKDKVTLTIERAGKYKETYMVMAQCETETARAIPISPSLQLLDAKGNPVPSYSRVMRTQEDEDPRAVTVYARTTKGDAEPAKVRIQWYSRYEPRPVLVRLRDVPLPNLQ